MKKFAKFLLIIVTTSFLISCNFNEVQYINPKDKPKVNYYTDKIEEHLKNNENYTIRIFDLNIYKYYDINKDEHTIIPEFIDNINIDNYGIDIDSTLTPEYKLIIEFETEKYIINVYSDTLVSIHPWDGIYPEDTIDMKDIPDYYNLFKYCEYIKKVSRGFEG